MTEPTDKPLLDEGLPDEQQLEEYLKGDSSVSRQYRQLHGAPVPAEIDRLVLRQAEDAVKRRSTQRPAWVRWTAPLAVAASAVLVLSIVVETGLRDETALTSAPEPPMQAKRREQAASGAAESAVPQAPAPAQEAEASGALEEKLARDATIMSDAVPSAQNVEPAPPASVRLDVPPPSMVISPAEPVSAAPAIAQSAPPPAPAETATYTVTSGQSVANAAAVAKRELQAASTELAERTEASSFSADEARQAVRSTAQRARSEEQQYSDPEAWLKDIRQLRKDDKQEEADREWRRFRAAFPAYEVAETDTAREAKK